MNRQTERKKRTKGGLSNKHMVFKDKKHSESSLPTFLNPCGVQIKGALPQRFCCILVKTAQIFENIKGFLQLRKN